MAKPAKYSDAQTQQIADALKNRMEEILALIAAIAAEVPECDMKLAEMLEGEPDVVRVAIIEKLRELLKEKAAEKESELERIIGSQQRQAAERQKSIFTQWLQWIMSEETLRKIRQAFLSSPRMELQVKNIGEELAALGVLQQKQPGDGKRALGELSANAPAVGQGQGKDTGKGRL